MNICRSLSETIIVSILLVLILLKLLLCMDNIDFLPDLNVSDS